MTRHPRISSVQVSRPRKKRSKYGAKAAVDWQGNRFDSKRERDRWNDLQLLEKAGEILDLERQVRIPLRGRDGPIMTDSGKKQRVYVADFTYRDRDGNMVVEDAKGFPTPEYRIKRAILKAQGISVVEA